MVVDLEKKLQERRKLQVEKTVSDRYDTRLRQGWQAPQALALGHLEYARGGGQLTWTQTDALRTERQQELQEVRLQLSEIASEEKRLGRPAEALENRSQAAAHLAALKAPVPTLKRFSSRDARKEYLQTDRKVQYWDQEVRKAGVTSVDDLQEQRARWQRDHAKVPTLEETAEGIGQTLERIAKALGGIATRLRDVLTRDSDETE
ncbi:MAG TPA: hypothetical protein VD969_26700 [Symbiobacteriaceae bacterium]|nr:hypothetical protein [Symbiobacteriaceae bacterium]